MQKIIVFLLLMFVGSTSANAQAIQDINYRYLYTASDLYTLDLMPVKNDKGWKVFFHLHTVNGDPSNYAIDWELRKSYSDKEGAVISDSLVVKTAVDSRSIQGYVMLQSPDVNALLLAKLKDVEQKRIAFHFVALKEEYPVNGYLKDQSGNATTHSYVNSGSLYTLASDDSRPTIITYYEVDFPAAVPVFSEGMARVPSIMRIDTSYTEPNGASFTFAKQGTYLIQKDTAAVKGYCVTVYDDYPKYGKLQSLADPLIYVCTKTEFDKIKQAGNDKRAFDRVILSITGDTERAKIFMRAYFKRVELANEYFDSFKEGWKTDRGMVYLIFGIPDVVNKFKDREVWTYKNETVKATFDFVRSGTLFDPDNYVLIRDNKFKYTWYEVIDLWRNARF